jgi:hypothetical protein
MTDEMSREAYKSAVNAALGRILGESGAKAIMFYVGEPNPETFGTKLRTILGEGASIVLLELDRQTKGAAVPRKRRWLRVYGRGTSTGMSRAGFTRTSFRSLSWTSF